MKKAELIKWVAATSGASVKDTERVLNGFRDVVQASVRRGNDLSYPGLGKFSRVARKARVARNPRTGAAIKVKASKAPKFTPSAGLKNVVKGVAPAPKVARQKRR